MLIFAVFYYVVHNIYRDARRRDSVLRVSAEGADNHATRDA